MNITSFPDNFSGRFCAHDGAPMVWANESYGVLGGPRDRVYFDVESGKPYRNEIQVCTRHLEAVDGGWLRRAWYKFQGEYWWHDFGRGRRVPLKLGESYGL